MYRLYRYDIFLSYASEDRDYVDLLREQLQGRPRFNVWYDETNISWGNNIVQKIQEGLSDSYYGIVMLSRSYLKDSIWITEEFNHILNSGRIFPILHGITRNELETKYPHIYKDIIKIHMISTNDLHIDSVLSEIYRVIVDSIVGQRKDFTKLRDLLAGKEWYYADLETFILVNKDGGIGGISHENLDRLNFLWLMYSDSQYGFSIQNEIYQKCSRSSKDDLECYDKFYADVGWEAIFDDRSYPDAPRGRFPALAYFTNELRGQAPLTRTDTPLTRKDIEQAVRQVMVVDTGTSWCFLILIVVGAIILTVFLSWGPNAAAGAMFCYAVFGVPAYCVIEGRIEGRRYDSERHRLVCQQADVLQRFFARGFFTSAG